MSGCLLLDDCSNWSLESARNATYSCCGGIPLGLLGRSSASSPFAVAWRVAIVQNKALSTL